MAQQTAPRGDVQPTTPAVARDPVALTDWGAIERGSEFQELVREKRRFIVPATIFFIVFYFALPISVGYFPNVMDTKVIGYINLAYLFALLQFIVAWAIMAAYVKRAGVFDRLSSEIARRVRGGHR